MTILLAGGFRFRPSFRACPFMFHVPSIRTHSWTPKTVHCEIILPLLRTVKFSTAVSGLSYLCKRSPDPLIEEVFNPTSTLGP